MRSPLFPIFFILFFSFLATGLSAQSGNIESAEEAKILVAAGRAVHAGEAREAVSLFQKLLKENALPKAYYLDYARVLQSLGMTDEALRWYRAYRDVYPGNELAENGIFACEHISSFRRNPYSIRLYVLPRINSPYMERHPLYTDGHLLFSREKGEERSWLEADPDIGALPVETGMASLIPARAADFDIESDTGSLVFAGKKGKNGNWQLYYKNALSAGAEKEVLLPFCSADFNTRYPAWSPGRQYLFFSSDRPGGFGGMDIWFLPRDSLFSASARNAGPLVNTAGDELAPAFSPSGALVFSSNGHPGLGGFDLFEIKMDASARFADSLAHLGSPLNSGYDELKMTWVSAGRGFLLSSRPGGQGLQDIFEWKAASDFLRFMVFDSTDGQPLSGVSFYALGKGGSMEFLGVSDAQGRISFLTKEKRRGGIRLEKAGYESRLISAPNHKLGKGAAIRVSLRREIDVRIAGIVKNKASGSPIAGVALRCASSGPDSLLLTTDSGGRFFLEARPGEHWVFDIHRNAYLPTHEELFTRADKKHALYHVTLWLNPLIEGKAIVLEEILFKYKSTEIDEEASRDLKKLLDMLIENPDLIVEISTHTDSRGGYQYNEILSQKRAQALVDWLVTRGVAPSRLVARGYGEYRLVNECADSVPCPEWKHRQNRRAEVKILGNRDTLKGLITAADHHWDIDPQEIPVYIPDSLKNKRQEPAKDRSHVAKNEEKAPALSPKTEAPLPATGEVYVVQFAASTRAGDRFPAAERMGPLIKEKFGRFTRFMIGPLPTLEEAYRLRDRLREKGFRDAFIVAYLEGKRLNIRY